MNYSKTSGLCIAVAGEDTEVVDSDDDGAPGGIILTVDGTGGGTGGGGGGGTGGGGGGHFIELSLTLSSCWAFFSTLKIIKILWLHSAKKNKTYSK